MAFTKFFPLSNKKRPRNLITTNSIDTQIWQELSAIRYHKDTTIVGRKAIAPWIDQAKIYFSDANISNWRSAGLLYYYSFLNLSKALLVGKKHFSYKLLNTTSIYHGLTAELQSVKNITDFKIGIYPPSSKKSKNVFSNLYKIVTNNNWPFNTSVTIDLKDIFPYCTNISSELNELFNINKCTLGFQSLIRMRNDNTLWFEVLAPKINVDTIMNLSPIFIKKIERQDLSEFDKNEWFAAYNREPNSFEGQVLIKTDERIYAKDNQKVVFKTLVTDVFENYSYPSQDESSDFPYWLFFPKTKINGTDIFCHSLLSDYLFSFALSSILRYQPQLLKDGTINQFLAESWCKQSPISVLKWFLLYFSDPPKRITRC